MTAPYATLLAMTSTERDLGEQPLRRLMVERGLRSHDLVAASDEQITHKMVARACKGRWLTPNVKAKIHRAFCRAASADLPLGALFTY